MLAVSMLVMSPSRIRSTRSRSRYISGLDSEPAETARRLYVLPLVAVLIAHSLFGERAEAHPARAREAIERLSPVVLTILTLGAGIVLVIRGANGLTSG